jgi:hypothetical protein
LTPIEGDYGDRITKLKIANENFTFSRRKTSMKLQALVVTALACSLLNAKLPDTKHFKSINEKLPASWEACHVFSLKAENGINQLLTSSVTEYNSEKCKFVQSKVGIQSAKPKQMRFGFSCLPDPGMSAIGRMVADPTAESGVTKAWKDLGTAGFAYNDNYDDRFMGPVFRLFKGYHIYTMDEAERNAAVQDGWTDQGIHGYLVIPEKINEFRKAYDVTTSHTWFRLFLSHEKACVYSSDTKEVTRAIESGYKEAGVLGYLF